MTTPKSKKAKEKSLTPRQSIFVHEYLVDLNATQAAIRAGYSAKTAEVQGPRLLGNVRIAAEIQKGMDRRAARVDIKADQVLAEVARLAFANMLDFIKPTADGGAVVDLSKLSREQAAAIQEVTVDQYMEGSGEAAREVKRIRFKLADKKGSLELLGRNLKMWTDKVDFRDTSSEFAGWTKEDLRRFISTGEVPAGMQGA